MSSKHRQVHFIRHAQTFFNVAHRSVHLGEDPPEPLDSLKFVDCLLTEEGKKQADQIKSKLENLNIDLAICSPFQRTIRTCLIAHGDQNVLLSSLCREKLCGVCDIGSSKEQLSLLYTALDFSTISENIWWYSGPEKFEDQDVFVKWFLTPERQLESDEALKARAAQFYDFLLTRTEQSIAVFSHSAFLRNFLHWHFNRPLDYIHNGDVLTFDLPNVQS